VKALSFHIDPLARFQEPGKRIRKSRRDLALQFRLPPLKAKPQIAPQPKTLPRKPPAKFLNSEKQILAASQTRYGRFVISTMRQRDGSWIAGFGRMDGGPLIVTGRKQAVMMTGPYLSESLALAEAQIRIDMRSGS
jgi:hypothetical protein